MRMAMSKDQRGVCVGCFLAYICAYFIRLNMSAALPAISLAMTLTPAQAGVLQTVFAVTYAAGQLVNGAVADRVSARVYISLGLALSALCNLLFSFAASYWQIVLLWCLNGASQSMLWTSIVKQVAVWFEGELRRKVSFAISLTLVLGHLGAWAFTGWLSDTVGWRLAFRLPALLALTVSGVVFCINRDKSVRRVSRQKSASAPLRALLSTGLVAMLIACVFNGFVRDGVVTWAPTIIRSGITSLSPTGVTLLIPLLNIMGVLGGKLYLSRLKGGVRVAIAGMTAASCLAAVLLWATGLTRIMLSATLLGVLCALLYGLNPLLTSLFPMEYDKMGRVALVAGFIDCFIYLGSALAGALTGALTESIGWNRVFALWAAAQLLGALLAVVSHIRSRSMR